MRQDSRSSGRRYGTILHGSSISRLINRTLTRRTRYTDFSWTRRTDISREASRRSETARQESLSVSSSSARTRSTWRGRRSRTTTTSPFTSRRTRAEAMPLYSSSARSQTAAPPHGREGRTPTASSAAASTTRSLSPSRGRPRPATSQTRYRFRFSGGIYNFFHVIYLKVRGFMFLINDILDEVLNDFKNFVENSDSLCELKDLRFDGGHTPDYSNQHIQQYYLLRYAYAYAFEYKWMYGKLLHSNYKTLPEKINILSLGTGSMLDYWAISQLLQGRKQVNYKGVDVIDWKYKIEAENDDKVEFINKDIVSYFKDFSSDTDFNPDIYIFPNSISELNPDDIGKICDQVQEKICEKDKVYFMFSLRTDEDSMNIDMKRTGLIYDALIEKGFITKDKRDVYFSIIDESQDKKIYEVDNSFCQPANVISYLVNLSNKCNDLKENKCNDNCLDRWPILKCRYMKYQIFSFEREG